MLPHQVSSRSAVHGPCGCLGNCAAPHLLPEVSAVLQMLCHQRSNQQAGSILLWDGWKRVQSRPGALCSCQFLSSSHQCHKRAVGAPKSRPEFSRGAGEKMFLSSVFPRGTRSVPPWPVLNPPAFSSCKGGWGSVCLPVEGAPGERFENGCWVSPSAWWLYVRNPSAAVPLQAEQRGPSDSRSTC